MLHTLLRLTARRLLAAALSLATLPALAHAIPGSMLLIDVEAHSLRLEQHLPLSELQIAYGHALSPELALGPQRDGLSLYLLHHLAVHSPDGRAWQLQQLDMDSERRQGQAELRVQWRLRPPAGAPLRRFVLESDAIGHEVINHKILLGLRRDFAAGALASDPPRLLDTLRYLHHRSSVQLDEGRAGAGFIATFQLGLHHIAEGTDHLLFLLTLLLVAPLAACAGRWQQPRPAWASLLAILGVVSAFTAGHSLTLALTALGAWQLPAQPVEVAIAASILVSAIHALRPLFGGREAWVAAGFGLVHGLAFGGVITELGLDGSDRLLALAGFNLGVEAMQLLVVAATMPWLIWASRGRGYTLLRQGLAAAAGLAAIAWLGERLALWANPFDASLLWASQHVLWLLAALAASALLARYAGGRPASLFRRGSL